MGEITQLLQLSRDGADGARNELFNLVYGELRRLAHRKLAGGNSLQLDAPSLVNEAYLRLMEQPSLPGGNRHMFFAYASGVMRSVIIDCVREQQSLKRGAGAEPLTLTTGLRDRIAVFRGPDLEALDTALEDLGRADPRARQIVEMRYFGGMSIEEIADALETSPATVKRSWQKARAYLFDMLKA
jgi:RNA polymerase sigma factor (TIGR02999 family)